MPSFGGFQVVLTADRTLMAGYQLLFDGMVAASQTTTTPIPLLGRFLMPRPGLEPSNNGHPPVRAAVAPLGLRRIEAALVEGGFDPESVAVVDQDHLRDAIGPDTRAIGVSSGEPLGQGMNTTTMTAIAGGTIYPAEMFRRLMRDVSRLRRERAPRAKVIAGGPGAWQLASDPAVRGKIGVDHVITGYAEGNAAAVFRAIVDGESLPDVIAGERVPAEAIPRIRGASTMGVVEISRGCGLGCSFCTIGRVPMLHLPEDAVAADVAANVANGQRNAALLSEDFFRYGAAGAKANPPAVLRLLRRVRAIDGVRLLQIDHANVLSIAQFSDGDLQAARELLAGLPAARLRQAGREPLRYPWVNVGVETASPRLLRENGGAAKMGTFGDSWPDACAREVLRLCRVGFFPLVSLLVGLPGETDDDVRATLAWVRSIAGERLSVFPMLHAPITDAGPAVRLNALHWRLIRECYRLNFRWIPRLYWDNQSNGGVGLPRRCVTQVLARGQMLEWRTLFALRAMGAAR